MPVEYLLVCERAVTILPESIELNGTPQCSLTPVHQADVLVVGYPNVQYRDRDARVGDNVIETVDSLEQIHGLFCDGNLDCYSACR